MDLNATLLGQMITFTLFVIFTMKFIWPPMTKALADRQKKIAEGLAAAERGHQELELAQKRASDQLKEAKAQANKVLEQAQKQAAAIVEEAKSKAGKERQRILDAADDDVQQARTRLREELKQEVVTIAVASAEKILGRSMDEAANRDLYQQMVKEL